MKSSVFRALPLASSQTVSWIHIGDTHLTRSGEQNEIDLGRIVDEINKVYAKGGLDFVYVPGDIADDGGDVAYGEFRRHLDRLMLPWCAIVGDHDVHEKNFNNFKQYVSEELYGSFSVGPYCFFRLNAFSEAKPDSFTVSEEQLSWLEAGLALCENFQQKPVVFLHCYPSDLKQGSQELGELLRRYRVLLVDMGHTHYNEISNDGKVLYSATRSTGQIEEGGVGYSVITLDGDTVSWHFVDLDSPSLVMITQPADERLMTERTAMTRPPESIEIHAKTWSRGRTVEVEAMVGNQRVPLKSEDGNLWTGIIDAENSWPGTELTVSAEDEEGQTFSSKIRFIRGRIPKRSFKSVDQDNAIGEWLDRGILGTQLGPNKNGKKW